MVVASLSLSWFASEPGVPGLDARRRRIIEGVQVLDVSGWEVLQRVTAGVMQEPEREVSCRFT